MGMVCVGGGAVVGVGGVGGRASWMGSAHSRWRDLTAPPPAHASTAAAASSALQVVVAEGAPRFDGHTMARKLADAGIQVTAISDSAVFGMMARANKVRGVCCGDGGGGG